jgi:hypothetical protein
MKKVVLHVRSSVSIAEEISRSFPLQRHIIRTALHTHARTHIVNGLCLGCAVSAAVGAQGMCRKGDHKRHQRCD